MANGQSLSGAAAGISAGEADIRASQAHMLDMSMGSVKLEEAQIGLAQQKRMLQLLNQQQPGMGGDPVRDLYTLGNIYLQSGMPEKAKEFYSTGSTLQKNSFETQKIQLEQVIKESDVMSGILERLDPHDDKSWQQANALFELETKRQSPYRGTRYDPTAVAELKAGIMSRKDKAVVALNKAREQDAKAAAEEHEARKPLIKAQTRLADTRENLLRRAGAGHMIPKASDLKVITDRAVKDYGKSLQDEDIRVLSRPVAERMLEILAKNPGMTQSEAGETAYQEAKKEGVYGGIRPRPAIPGRSSNAPAELPMAGGKVDKGKLRENTWYKVDGEPMLLMEGQLYTQKELLELGVEAPDEAEPPENPDDTAPAE